MPALFTLGSDLARTASDAYTGSGDPNIGGVVQSGPGTSRYRPRGVLCGFHYQDIGSVGRVLLRVVRGTDIAYAVA
eukprot:3190092-Rhodomonas_salina.1